ncbi:MAG: PG0541 family transporter-associated protein [candidate division WOR-3 bacterium]
MLFVVICSAPFMGEFENALMDRGIEGYTIIPKVLGRGGSSEPVMDNDVWPGYSVMFVIFVESEKLGDLKGVLKDFSQRVKPFKVFALKEVEVI